MNPGSLCTARALDATHGTRLCAEPAVVEGWIERVFRASCATHAAQHPFDAEAPARGPDAYGGDVDLLFCIGGAR